MRHAPNLPSSSRSTRTRTRGIAASLGTIARRAFLPAVVAAGVLGISVAASADPFRSYTWGFADPSDTPNLSPMVWVTTDSNLDTLASQIMARPAGSRWLLMFGYVNDLANNPADRCIQRTTTTTTTYVTKYVTKYVTTGTGRKKRTVATQVPVTTTSNVDTLTSQRGPWMDNGLVAVQSRMQSLVSGLKARGVQVDGFVFDNETTLHATHFLSVPGAFATIQADPRWPALASQMGLPLDISSLSVMYWGSPLYYQWIELMAGRFDNAMNAAVYAPIKAAYPAAAVSNYESAPVTAGHESPDSTGKLDRYATPGFGTHDTGEFYGCLTPMSIAACSSSVVPVAGDPWTALRLQVHRLRGLLASGSHPKQAWVANRSWGDLWTDGAYVPFASSPYWDEMVLQLGMSGVSTFLDWNSDAWQAGVDPTLYNPRADRLVLDGLLGTLNRVVGAASGGIISLAQPSWSDRVLASGRQVGDSMVWRFSFDEGIAGVSVYFSDGTSAMVAPEAGTHGAWLSYPASKTILMDAGGAMPRMTVNASTLLAGG